MSLGPYRVLEPLPEWHAPRTLIQIFIPMLPLIKNYQINLVTGSARFVAATRVDDEGPNLNFICLNRIVYSQPKREVESFHEWNLMSLQYRNHARGTA